jgi:toxin ParE1/3/4
MKVARLREIAQRDIDDAIEYYFGEGGESLALRFVDDLERALALISQYPAAGSPRVGYELQLPGVRARSLRDFPFLVFYAEQVDFVDVWRVLHGRRDVPAWLIGQDA